MRRVVVAFLVLAGLRGADAQTLVVPPTTPPGVPIIAKIEGLPEGARVAWRTSPGAGVVNAGKGRAYLWASASHTVSAVVALADAEAELIWLDAPFALDGSPTPPQPPAPVKTLKELAGADAEAIAGQLAALARVLQPADAKLFPAAIVSSLAPWKDNAAYGPIIKRLGSLVDHAAIVAETAKVVTELGGGPAPLPPGKRRLIILHETAEQTPEQASLFNELRTGAAAAELKAAGHTLDILDEELRPDLTATPPPSLYVFDATSNAVVRSLPLPTTAAAVLEAVR